MDKIYSIKFDSYWHIGSGLSGGMQSDSLVLRDRNGFPYIPGKTLKGLIRQSAMILKEFKNDIDEDFITELFGREDKLKENEIDNRKPGKLYFTNACLSQSLQKKLDEDKNILMLYEKIASNRIDDTTGTTVKNSLREIEVCIPVTLFAKITDIPDDKGHLLEDCLKMVKRMGLSRNRGLGRCELKFTEEVINGN